MYLSAGDCPRRVLKPPPLYLADTVPRCAAKFPTLYRVYTRVYPTHVNARHDSVQRCYAQQHRTVRRSALYLPAGKGGKLDRIDLPARGSSSRLIAERTTFIQPRHDERKDFPASTRSTTICRKVIGKVFQGMQAITCVFKFLRRLTL